MNSPEDQYINRFLREISAGIESPDATELDRLRRELMQAARDGSLTVDQLRDLQDQELTPQQNRDLLAARKMPRDRSD